MVTRWKPSNISRIVNMQRCCSGYQEVNQKCQAVCSVPCKRGTCAEPNVCSCEPGWSGETVGLNLTGFTLTFSYCSYATISYPIHCSDFCKPELYALPLARLYSPATPSRGIKPWRETESSKVQSTQVTSLLFV